MLINFREGEGGKGGRGEKERMVRERWRETDRERESSM